MHKTKIITCKDSATHFPVIESGPIITLSIDNYFLTRVATKVRYAITIAPPESPTVHPMDVSLYLLHEKPNRNEPIRTTVPTRMNTPPCHS